jgi:CubicO group peptidase (beta-lactamase class C family)
MTLPAVLLVSALAITRQEPSAPARGALSLWLAAVNSGDREAVRRFVAERYAPPPNAALPVDRIAGRVLGVFESTGGVTLLKTDSPSPNSVVAYLRARRTGFCVALSLAVEPQVPHRILGMGLRDAETPADLLPPGRVSDRELKRRLDALLGELASRNAFSGVVLVAKDGRTAYGRAFGTASRVWDAPNRLDTRFNLASITKMFTAVAVAQLVESGKLSYEDTVGKLLP